MDMSCLKMEATGVCWKRQNVTEPVSVRASPCVQRVRGPMQAVTVSEAKSFTAVRLARNKARATAH